MSTLRRTGVLVITSVLTLGTTTTVAQASSAPAGNRAVARPLVSAHGWNKSQFDCLSRLWTRESNWNHRAYNRSSGAYGIPQALPGSKMAGAGRDWRTNPRTQIRWGLGYIKQRYGSPCRAWTHFTTRGWY
ncbi:transglycosylase SLT domain-containing protein [Streptosporangium sp. NBC_01495]|uniref:aggregation-promoting factor C-terminal-like domain-containing protein n=1 Tax=Streptosporangium sp. NBC_01495 TaxID=2903899 RepID=UPI002E36C3DE|nr:transglycosylase SLT domain-containing protein [Streptosporangium sp. NBC_01495]